MTTSPDRTLKALHALLPAVTLAQSKFDRMPDSDVAIKEFNASLELAFRAMCMDMRGQGERAMVHDERALEALMTPKGENSLWFRFADPHVTAQRLSDLARHGDFASFTKSWPGPARDYLPPGIEATPDERLYKRMEKSLRNGAVINVGDIQVRYARKGDTWDESAGAELHVIEALGHGVYLRHPALDRDGAVVGHRWLHHGSMEDLQSIAQPHVDRLSAMEREQLMQSMAFEAAMKTILKAEREVKASALARVG